MISIVWGLLGGVILGSGIWIGAGAVRNHEHPGAVPFGLLSILLSTLAALIAFEQSGLLPIELNTMLELLLIGGYAFASLLWISFVFEYTGRGPVITWQRGLGLVLLGSLALASTAITWLQQTGQIRFGVLGEVSYLSTFALQIAVFSLGLLGAVLIVRSAITYDDLPLGRGLAFVAGGIGITLLPLTVGYTQQIGRPATLRMTVLQIGLVMALFAGVQLATDPFAQSPSAGHLARETVLDAMTAPVIVVDRAGRVLDVNQAAADVFSLDTTALRDSSLADVTDNTEDTLHGDSVTLQTATGRREFIVERSEITDTAGNELGHAYRFRDVTDRETREQRLQVLNRVTRHNLRNDLDAIRGFAEPIRDEELPPEEATRYFDRIETIASDLVNLASTIERSERVMAKSSLERERSDLTAIARTVAEDSGCEQIAVVAQGQTVEIQSDRDAIRLILQELVDNAVTHSNRETPTVEISVQQTALGGRLAVRDDGPGIPEDERAVLVEGAETPVKHGSGVGLWLVYWAVTRLGGQLEFQDAEPRGSIVTVDLPDLAGRDGSAP